MSKFVSAITGGGTKKLRAAQAAQQAAIDREAANVAAVEAGQRRLRGGGSGFLAYVEDQLKTRFGG